MLAHVGISEKANSYPGQLSGGQRQRVGIARELGLHPQVLLSDEATSGLDPQATESILKLLRNLRDELGLSIILTKHEMDVVRTVADRVAVLRAGEIVESGSVRDLIAYPQSSIGRHLLPIKPTSASDHALLSLEVTYSAQRNVPADWVSLVGETLHARVQLLGGVIEDIAAHSVGRLLIGLEFQAGEHKTTNAVVGYLESLGLVVTVRSRSERAEALVRGAA